MAHETVDKVKAMSPEHKLLIAWIAAPLVYDLKSREGGTFSEGIHRLRRRHALLVDVAIITTALHFMERLDKRLDPFHQGLKVKKVIQGGDKMKIRGEGLGLWGLAGRGFVGGVVKYVIPAAFEDYVVKPAKSSLGRFSLSGEARQVGPEAAIQAPAAEVNKLGELSLLPAVSGVETSDITELAA